MSPFLKGWPRNAVPKALSASGSALKWVFHHDENCVALQFACFYFFVSFAMPTPFPWLWYCTWTHAGCQYVLQSFGRDTASRPFLSSYYMICMPCILTLYALCERTPKATFVLPRIRMRTPFGISRLNVRRLPATGLRISIPYFEPPLCSSSFVRLLL